MLILPELLTGPAPHNVLEIGKPGALHIVYRRAM